MFKGSSFSQQLLQAQGIMENGPLRDVKFHYLVKIGPLKFLGLQVIALEFKQENKALHGIVLKVFQIKDLLINF